MSAWRNTLRRLLDDPSPRNYRYSELVSILTALGFTLAKTGAGSHRKWRLALAEPTAKRTITIGLVDDGQPVKAVYAKHLRETLIANHLVPDKV